MNAENSQNKKEVVAGAEPGMIKWKITAVPQGAKKDFQIKKMFEFSEILNEKIAFQSNTWLSH